MAEITWVHYSTKIEPPECDNIECLIDDGIDWVSVSHSSEDDIVINILPAKCPTDLTTAFVVISASTGDIQTIPVTRCKGVCTCDIIKYKAISPGTLDSNAKTNVKVGEYSQDCKVCLKRAKAITDSTVLINPRMENGNIYVDVTKNESCETRIGWYRFMLDDVICGSERYNVAQNRYVNPCESTDASKVGVSFDGGGTGKTVDYNSHSLSFNISYGDSCWSLTSSSTSAAWMTLNGNTVTVDEYSDTSNDRNGYITFEFESYTPCGGVKTCTKTLSITQESKPKPECNCDNLTVTGKTNIDAVGGDSITIGSFTKIDCMSNPRATSSASWLSNITISGGDIKANVSSNVEETETSDRTATVTVSVDKDGGTCDKDMEIKQKGYTPSPTHCEIEGADTIDSCNGGTEKYEIKIS